MYEFIVEEPPFPPQNFTPQSIIDNKELHEHFRHSAIERASPALQELVLECAAHDPSLRPDTTTVVCQLASTLYKPVDVIPSPPKPPRPARSSRGARVNDAESDHGSCSVDDNEESESISTSEFELFDLMGKPFETKEPMKFTPPMLQAPGPDTPEGKELDSVVATLGGIPRFKFRDFIIYNGSLAYPEFLITYTRETTPK